MIAILSTVGALAGLCGPVPGAPADPADSAAYLRVGDDARAAGDVRIAAIAYRAAVARDPANAAARRALDALCSADDARLQDGIAQFRAGELDAATATLRPIASGGGAAAAGAHFFLGLIALRHHDGRGAEHDFDAAAHDPAYAALARSMTRLARRDGRIAVFALVAPELDTNAELLPDTPPKGSGNAKPATDEDLLLATGVTARPQRWLVVRDTVTLRAQRALSALDFFGNSAQVGVELDHGLDHLGVLYELDDDLLDGASYLVAQRGAASYRHDLHAGTLSASYSLRRRDYRQASEAPFTGYVHSVELGLSVPATDWIDVDLRAQGWRESTADTTFSDLAGGGLVAVRARLAGRWRLSAALAAWYAHYDTAEPDGTLRRDVHGELASDVEIDLDDHVIALAGVGVTHNGSTIDDFRYTTVILRVGLAFAFGWL